MTLDVPKLDVQIVQVHNVNVSCDPAPASLPADQVYTNLTNIIPSIGFDALEVFQATAPDFTAGLPFYQNVQHNFSTTCLAFNAAQQTLAPATEIKPSQIGFSTGKTGAAPSMHITVVGVVLAVSIAVIVVM